MRLKINHKEINPIQHELRIEFEWEEVEKRIPETLKEFKKNTSIKGFRKGKAPENVVRAQIGEKRIHEQAAEKAAYDAFNQVMKNSNQDDTQDSDDHKGILPADAISQMDKIKESSFPQPIIPPEINLDEIKEGEPVSFIAKYFTQPPDPHKIAEEHKKKHMPEMFSSKAGLPVGSPDLQSHGLYSNPADVLENLSGMRRKATHALDCLIAY